ncbi:MAG: MFS transporter, partial [Sciscionella sp.]
YVANPPIRSADEDPVGALRPVRASWLHGSMIGLLAVAFGSLFVLVGGELAMIAALQEVGKSSLAGAVTVVMAAASALGGAIYGALHRGFPSTALLAGMSLLMLPVGLAGHQWWLLAIALIPTNLLCAPTLSSVNDAVSRLAPPAARGEAMGLSNSADTLGVAAGSPLIGLIIDVAGSGAGFLAAGAGGLAVAGAAMLTGKRARENPPPQPDPSETSTTQGAA